MNNDSLERAFALFRRNNFDHVLGGQRLEIEPVGGVVVGRDRLRVAVDHDGFIAGLGQREAGVAAAVVELDTLTDAVRSAAQDYDLIAIGGGGFANGCARQPTLVCGVHVRGW